MTFPAAVSRDAKGSHRLGVRLVIYYSKVVVQTILKNSKLAGWHRFLAFHRARALWVGTSFLSQGQPQIRSKSHGSQPNSLNGRHDDSPKGLHAVRRPGLPVARKSSRAESGLPERRERTRTVSRTLPSPPSFVPSASSPPSELTRVSCADGRASYSQRPPDI